MGMESGEESTIREVSRSDRKRWPWEDPDGKAAHTGGLKMKGEYMYGVANWDIRRRRIRVRSRSRKSRSEPE